MATSGIARPSSTSTRASIQPGPSSRLIQWPGSSSRYTRYRCIDSAPPPRSHSRWRPEVNCPASKASIAAVCPARLDRPAVLGRESGGGTRSPVSSRCVPLVSGRKLDPHAVLSPVSGPCPGYLGGSRPCCSARVLADGGGYTDRDLLVGPTREPAGSLLLPGSDRREPIWGVTTADIHSMSLYRIQCRPCRAPSAGPGPGMRRKRRFGGSRPTTRTRGVLPGEHAHVDIRCARGATLSPTRGCGGGRSGPDGLPECRELVLRRTPAADR